MIKQQIGRAYSFLIQGTSVIQNLVRELQHLAMKCSTAEEDVTVELHSADFRALYEAPKHRTAELLRCP